MAAAALPFDDQSEELGVDVALLDDLAPVWGLAGGRINLGYALARRLSTPRGSLFYDPTYGMYLPGYLNAKLGPADLSNLRGSIAAECERDPRVLNAAVTVALVSQRNLKVSITVTTADGPFDLVLAATAVTVLLLEVDGAPAEVASLPDSSLNIIAAKGVKGDTGEDGVSPGGVGTGGFELDFGDEIGGVKSTSEEVVFQRLCNLSELAGSITASISAQILSEGGTATFRVRIGGTDNAADGTIHLTVTTGSPTYVTGAGSATFLNPTGHQLVKITAQNATLNLYARIKNGVLRFS